MTFRFQCPQGHVLEGDESQAGQACTCPMCGLYFVIPMPAPVAPPPPPPPPSPPVPPMPNVTITPPAPAVVAAPEEPKLFHIPCPNGHELEAPVEMLEQEVTCPHCSAQFLLREKDSVEYKRKKQLERERREEKVSRLWLQWAIVIAVIVLGGLLALLFFGGHGE